jgi:hypothetical protein
MGLVTKTNTYTAGSTILASEVNTNEDTLYTLVNGNIENANVKAGAAIAESKIAFDTSSGHDHDGTDSKAIPRGFAFSVVGTLSTGTSQTPALIALQAMTISKVYANVKTAPTGASILVDINKNGTSIWATTQANRLTVAAAATTGTQTSFDTTALAEGDILTIDLDQVGSSVAGADITITVKA